MLITSNMPTKADLIKQIEVLTKRTQDLETQIKSPPPDKVKAKTKRAPSKYALFVKAHFKEVREKNPDLPAKSIMAEIAQIWHNEKKEKEKEKEYKTYYIL